MPRNPLDDSPRKRPLQWLAAGLALGLASVASLAQEGSPATVDGDSAGAAFERLKALEGTWRIADREDHPLRITFYPTAGGKTLVESWEANGRPHSLTVYHRDGTDLLATHYCPQGNQPRLAFAQGEDGQLSFKFRDVTDLDPAKEQHTHELSFAQGPDGRLVRSEEYRDGEGGKHPTELVLVRDR